MKVKHLLLGAIIIHSPLLHAEDIKTCSGYACIDTGRYNNTHKTITIRTNTNKPLLCFTRYDGEGYTYWLDTGAKTFYLPNEYPLALISWRCDVVEDRCPVWSDKNCKRFRSRP